jgi:hypothetical protein
MERVEAGFWAGNVRAGGARCELCARGGNDVVCMLLCGADGVCVRNVLT